MDALNRWTNGAHPSPPFDLLGAPIKQLSPIPHRVVRMSVTTSRVFPISSLVSVDSVPISLWRRRPSDRPPARTPPTESDGPLPDHTDLLDHHSSPASHAQFVVTDRIQDYGAAIGLEKTTQGHLVVSMASDNSEHILGYSPSHLFALQDFLHLLDPHQSDALLDHITEAHDRATYSSTLNVFDMSVRQPGGSFNCFSCVIHADTNRPSLFLCEFIPQHTVIPARSLRQDRRDRRREPTTRPAISRRASATETLKSMSRAQDKITVASTPESLFQNLVASIRIATEHEHISVHRFDGQWKGRLVARSEDHVSFEYFAEPPATESCELSPECRKAFETHEVQVHVGPDANAASLVHRPTEDFEHSLDNSCYLRLLPEFTVHGDDESCPRSRVMVPLMVSGRLWGVVVAKCFVPDQPPITFLGRGLCRLIADSMSTKLENIVASDILDTRGPFSPTRNLNKKGALAFPAPRDLLSTLKAHFAISFINGTKTIMGSAREPQEGLALIEYLQSCQLTENLVSIDIAADFPGLHYSLGFHSVKSFLFIPLSQDGMDFVVYFQELDPAHLGHDIFGWSEADLRNADVMRVVYCKFSTVWKERDTAVQESRLYKLLLSNSSHEFRTLLNAIMNYMEFAMEGTLDAKGTNLVKLARNTSQPLLHAVTRLLDYVDKQLES
ncbi:hypothetical protein D6D03_04081 [Aureobasidium pullulans]|nr:hypothetical protein D6D03_04081 [Aureobasidium pullulans]